MTLREDLPADPALASTWMCLPCAVRILGLDGSVVAENAAYRATFAASAAAIGSPHDPGHAPAFRAAEAGDARAVPIGEVAGRTWVAEYFPVRGGQGTVTHVGVLYREAPRAAATASLSDAAHAGPVEQQLRFVIDMIPQLIWSTRPDGYHDFYNRRWYEFTGATPDETKGAGWNDPLHPDDQQRAWERWQRSLASGEDYEIEYRFRRHDGVYRWFLGRAVAMRDEAGRIVRWFGTCTDIDDAKRLEEQRVQVLAQSEANGRMKDEFLATVSHELRTPLTSILGWARIQRERPEMAPKATEVIERNAVAQAELIEEILDTSRIIAGTVRLDAAPVDFGDVVRNAADSVRPTADAKGLTLDVDIEPELEPVVGDAGRLLQIASNVLTNAVKFTGRGGRVTVTLRRAPGGVALVVADTGKGIAASFLPHVFERFRQADGGTTRRHGGLGLGLAIVKHLVELHGGSIDAASPGEGAGATFRVVLPCRGGDPLASTDARAAIDVAPASKTERRLDGADVLVVDDEPDTRDLVATVLRHAGATVREAGSVDEALAIIAKARPDVVVSDVGMPGRDGYTLVRALRERMGDGTGRVPAIALTAYARGQDQERAAAAGFDVHLAKPVDPVALIASIHRLRAP